MLCTAPRHFLRKVASRQTGSVSAIAWRFKSSSVPEEDSETYAFDKDGETSEYVSFSVSRDNKEEKLPVLLNAQEHAVGYLSKILNARVYEAAIETELQEAKNLSSVCHRNFNLGPPVRSIDRTFASSQPFFHDSISRIQYTSNVKILSPSFPSRFGEHITKWHI
jgi:hypothetical protein